MKSMLAVEEQASLFGSQLPSSPAPLPSFAMASSSLLPHLFALPSPSLSQSRAAESISSSYGCWEDLIRDEQLNQDRQATQHELNTLDAKVFSLSPLLVSKFKAYILTLDSPSFISMSRSSLNPPEPLLSSSTLLSFEPPPFLPQLGRLPSLGTNSQIS